MRRLFAVLAAIVFATIAQAHQLNVFAFVEDGFVIVETKFSTGKIPVSGDVRVLDADGQIVQNLTLAADGTARFPLETEAATGGMTIEVTTGEGHEDYWILTPEDIANGTGG